MEKKKDSSKRDHQEAFGVMEGKLTVWEVGSQGKNVYHEDDIAPTLVDCEEQ